jgi:transcriptional regulator of acetoin/glycerol metabolism
LKNVLEKAATSCEGTTIKLKDLPDYLYSQRLPKSKSDDLSLKTNLLRLSKQTAEKKLLEAKLSNNNWNKTKTANELGISRPLLYSLIKKYGLIKPKTGKPLASD